MSDLAKIFPLLLMFVVLVGCSKRTAVSFSVNGYLNSSKQVEVRVVNRGVKAVEIFARDYLFSVSCKDTTGGSMILLPDNTIEWPSLTAGTGYIVNPGETKDIVVSYNAAKPSQVGCKLESVEYRWP